MQAQTIELLSGKGKFSMEQALTLAEAMDGVIEKAQVVTIPILDARLAMVSARFDALEAKLDSKFERWTMRMIIAMLLSQTATGPIGMHVFESMRQMIATVGH